MEQGYPKYLADGLLAEEQEGRGPINFRHNSDIERFYRFVYENNLRREAQMLLDKVIRLRRAKANKAKKAKIAH